MTLLIAGQVARQGFRPAFRKAGRFRRESFPLAGEEPPRQRTAAGVVWLAGHDVRRVAPALGEAGGGRGPPARLSVE
ncbi:MAG: hypothetical protein LBR80_09050 [Deltaproteobacteria bacterium]|nr:hypothetical protein [Deltaproteobacteria bacterium]